MNKVKVRVWNTKSKYFLNIEEDPDYLFGIDSDASLYLIDNGNPVNDENYIIQLCTGVKDDEGNDIYEGDILEARYAPSYDLQKYEVKWNQNGASFVCYRKHENPSVQFEQLPLQPSNSMENLKVLGNIFENLELLEG